MAEPMDVDTLVALARERFEQADRENAKPEDFRQLLDIFPAVLQRLREKAAITRNVRFIPHIDLRDPGALDRVLASRTNEG